MTDTNLPKINHMNVCTPPRKGKDGAEVLATFDVMLFPVHAKNMMLVRRGGQLKLWTSNTDLRFIASAREMIIDAAMETAREAIDRMGEIVE